MELARVEGSVVATAKNDRLDGHKLLLVNLVGLDLKPTSNFLVAVDSVGAGDGEIVIVVRGSSARQSEQLAHQNRSLATAVCRRLFDRLTG